MIPPTDEELEAVQLALDNDGASIITIGNRLGQEAAALVMATAKPIKKLQSRLLQDAAKKVVTTDNGIDFITTSLLNGVNTWLQEADFLLQNLAVKGGVIKPGDPLTAALAQAVADEPQLEYLGTLVLAVKEAAPWLDRIAVACERMANALERANPPSSPVPASIPGQAAAVLAEIEDDFIETTWPEV